MTPRQIGTALALLACAALLSCSAPSLPAPEADEGARLFTLAEEHEDQARFREAVDTYRLAAEVYQDLARSSLQEADWARLVTCLNRMGWHLSVSLGDHNEARRQLERAVAIGHAHLDDQPIQILHSYHNLAVVAFYQGRLDEALELNNKLLAWRSERFGDRHDEVAATLNNLGMVYLARGDLVQAALYYERALAIKTEHHGPHHASLANTWLNLGRIHTLLGNHDKAVAALQTCYELRSANLPAGHPQIAAAALTLGMAFKATGQYPRAHELLLQAADLQRAAFGDDHPHLAHTLWELGMVETLLGEEAKGLRALERALEIIARHFGEHDYHLAESQNHLAWHHWYGERWDPALAHMDRALQALDYRPGTVEPAGNFADESLIRCLQGRAVILLTKYRSTGEIDLLQRALADIDDAVGVMARRSLDFLAQDSKLLLNARHRHLLTMGVHAALECYRQTENPAYLDLSFAYSEKSRMAILREGLDDVQARQFASIPEEQLQQEHQKVDRIHQLGIQLAREEEDPSAATNELMPQLLDAYRDLESFVLTLEKDYPRYYQLKYAPLRQPATPLSGLVTDEKTALLGYHIGDGLLTLFAATHERVVAHQVNLDGGPPASLPVADWLLSEPAAPRATLMTAIDKLRTGLIYGQPDTVAYYGRRLYRTLLEPVADEIAGKDLYIIPDGQLGFLPFETLLEREPGARTAGWDLPFMIKSHSIAYGYSAQRSQAQGGQAGVVRTRTAAAFAPVFQADASAARPAEDTHRTAPVRAAPLPRSATEIEAIGALFARHRIPFRGYIGEEATEEACKRALREDAFIHLATHGVIDAKHPESSRLLLAKSADGSEDGTLYLGDLFALDSRAELVVLSACETGLGEISAGEGILGFCRGFFYAGAAAVMASLWRIDDAGATPLMTAFYDRILDGQRSDRALREAKLGLIGRGTPPSAWAPFVLITNQPQFPQP